MIFDSDYQCNDIQACIVKEEVETELKVMSDGGQHNNHNEDENM